MSTIHLRRSALVLVSLFTSFSWSTEPSCYSLLPTPEERRSIEHYDSTAASYVSGTHNLDISEARDRFVTRLVPEGAELEIGSGSGRDSLVFQNAGFLVTAIDPSRELARHASRILNQPVLVMRAQEIDFEDRFDGVWAMASLIHIPQEQEGAVYAKIARALRRGGFFFRVVSVR